MRMADNDHCGDLSSGFVAMSSRALVHSNLVARRNFGVSIFTVSRTQKSNRSFVCTKFRERALISGTAVGPLQNLFNSDWTITHVRDNPPEDRNQRHVCSLVPNWLKHNHQTFHCGPFLIWTRLFMIAFASIIQPIQMRTVWSCMNPLVGWTAIMRMSNNKAQGRWLRVREG